MGGLQYLAPTATAAEVVEAVRADGACIVDDLAPAEALDRVDAELEPWLDRTPYGTDDFAGPCTRRTGALVARCPRCASCCSTR